MANENYWLRRAGASRLSRRGFVGGAAATGLGAAALGLVGCGDDDDEEPSGGGTTPAASASAAGTAATSPTAAASKPKGGIARFSSANNTWDTFDSDRSRFSPFAVLIGYMMHGIVQWESFDRGKIGGGFASSWEQPDKNTFVFKVAPGLTWHNKPPVNGRAATAKDAAAFILRNKAGKTIDGKEDKNFYRQPLFQTFDKVEAVDDKTLRITTTKPDPFVLNLFAGSYSKVQAPEAVEKFEADYSKLNADYMIGTGNFVLTAFKAEGSSSIRRFDKAILPPNVDGIEYVPLFVDEAGLQAAFEQKQIDAWAPRQKATLDDMKKRYEGKIYEKAVFSANPMAGTYYGGTPPWSNQNLIGAIFRTIDRRQLIAQMFQGRGVLAGSPPPTQAAFTFNEKELVTYPGYLEDRAKDLAEAKKMWEAGGGPALGEIIVDIPDIWEGAYSGVSALITGMLKANLGNTFTAKIEPYATITSKLVKQEYGNGKNNIWYGWISELTDMEPSQLLYASHNSASSQWKQFEVKIPKVDDLTNQLIQEFDATKRQQLCKDVAKELLNNYGAGVPYNMVNINNTLYHNYYHTGESQPFITAPNFARDVYIDSKDPTFQGRPA